MKPDVARAALIAASLSALAATPVAAQDATAGHSFMETSRAAVLVVCTSAVRDKFDFNNAAPLARYGLTPLSDASEAALTSYPGIQAAIARFDNGTVLAGRTPNGPCRTMLTGSDRILVRDRLVADLVSHGAQSQRRDGADYQQQVLEFGEVLISVITKPTMVSVVVQLKQGAAAPAAPAKPAAPRPADEARLRNASLGAVLSVCVGMVDGTFDMNDAAALRPYDLEPADSATEARLRKNVPGLEYAELALLPAGVVSVGYTPEHICHVRIVASSSIAIRDELVHRLLDTHVRATRATSEQNDDILIFHFTSYTI